MYAGIDYETYYDKDCTITDGLQNYLKHDNFDADSCREELISIIVEVIGKTKDKSWFGLGKVGKLRRKITRKFA